MALPDGPIDPNVGKKFVQAGVSHERQALYLRAKNFYGDQIQHMVLAEEVGGLLDALSKFRRGRSSLEQVIDALADVRIVSEQLALQFGLNEVELVERYKLDRLEKRISAAGSQFMDPQKDENSNEKNFRKGKFSTTLLKFDQPIVSSARTNLYRKASETFGEDMQYTIFTEELGELLTALSQYKRGRNSLLDVIEEVADLRVVTEHLSAEFGAKKVLNIERKKLRRLEKILNAEENFSR